MRIKVTQEHIDKSKNVPTIIIKRKFYFFKIEEEIPIAKRINPIFLALRDVGFKVEAICADSVILYGYYGCHYFSKKVEKWLNNWDKGVMVSPFSFEFNIEDELRNKI